MPPLSRRACLAAGALALARGPLAASELVVGYLYVGPRDDYGYNQSHAEAARAVARLPGVRVVEQERVPESDAAAAAMEAMIVEEGASVLFPTSYGYYDPYILDLARAYPEVTFLHCGGAWREGTDPRNVCSYFGHMHEAQHLAGIAAAAGSPDGQLGFVASNRYPGVMRNLNSFALGARWLRPDATVRAVFTGSWSDPVREAEAVNAMVDRGATAIGCSVDSARTVVETAQRRGVLACGYNASAAQFGPDSYLTAALAHWATHNAAAVEAILDGGRPPNFFSGGLAEGIVTADESSALFTGELAASVERRRGEIVDGGWIWSGPLRDSEGNLRVDAGERIEREDKLLRRMDWFVEGVLA